MLPAATRETKPWTLKGRWRLCLLGGARERGGGGSRLLARGARASLAPLVGHGLPPTGLVGYLLHRRALPRLLDDTDSPTPDEPLADALDARVDSGHGARFEVAPALVRPVRGAGAARVAVGHTRQAEVGAWPHGAAPTAPEAAVGDSVERGDALVRLDEADVLRAQRVAFHAALLAAEPRQWWS